MRQLSGVIAVVAVKTVVLVEISEILHHGFQPLLLAHHFDALPGCKHLRPGSALEVEFRLFLDIGEIVGEFFVLHIGFHVHVRILFDPGFFVGAGSR